MARDRLAALRAQQHELPQAAHNASYGDLYPSLSSSDDGSYKPRRIDQDTRYEMQEVHLNTFKQDDNDMAAFYSEISSIQDSLRTFNDNISRISDLHARSLHYLDEHGAQRNAAQLDGLVEETSALSNQLKVQIKNLHAQSGSGRDGQIRQQQTALVKHKFVEAIKNYQQVEQQYRAKYKQRMERQFKTIKPDATPEEVKAVVNDDSGGELFAQALRSSNQHGESRAVHREVQGRHDDIKRIERTLTELAQLFNDMGMLVAQQDRSLDGIYVMASNVEKNAGVGLQHAEKATASARAARKKKWRCLGIVVLVFLIVAGSTVAVVVTELANNNNNNN